MNRIFTFLLLILIINTHQSFSQTYHPFNVTAYDSIQSTGYYFFCPYRLSAYPTFPSLSQHHMILDHKGNVVYYRSVAGFFAGDFKLQPNGQISYCGRNHFYLMDSTFTVVDSVTTKNGVTMDIHDLQILPNGHYLILGNEDVHRDMSSYPIFLHNNTFGSTNAVITAYVIQELDAAKNVVFEWHSIDHYGLDDADDFWLTDTTRVDWTHVNSVEMDFDGNFLVSSRHFDEITKISRTDSSIIWRMGGKRNQFTFIGDSMHFLSQHDSRRLANGNLSLFDNGRPLNPLHYASAKEYTLDEINLTATLVWSHTEGPNHWSRSQGNTQRLQNSNTLISYGNLLPTPIVFNVVDSLQNKIFEVVFPDSLISYRSFNFNSLPWNLNRPQITCTVVGNQHFLTAESGHSKYIWSTGDSTQSIPVSTTGDFHVFVPIGDSGYISSEILTVADTADPCGLINHVNLVSEKNFLLYPNPADNTINITYQNKAGAIYEIWDVVGRKVKTGKLSENDKSEIDVSKLQSGVYFFRLENQISKFIIRRR